MTPWLLCIWHARAADVPWWACLVLFTVLSAMCEIVAAGSRHASHAPSCSRVSDAVGSVAGLGACVYVLSTLCGPHLAPAFIALLLVNAVVEANNYDYGHHHHDIAETAAGLVAAVAVIRYESGTPPLNEPGLYRMEGWQAWLGWALSTLWMAGQRRSRWGSALCGLTVPALAFHGGIPSARQPWPSLSPSDTQYYYAIALFPSLCMTQRHCMRTLAAGIRAFRARGGREDGLNSLHRQQLLLYAMAWAVALGLASRGTPDVLVACLCVVSLCVVMRLAVVGGRLKVSTMPSQQLSMPSPSQSLSSLHAVGVGTSCSVSRGVGNYYYRTGLPHTGTAQQGDLTRLMTIRTKG